jgi:pyridoxamine 5'-phosphate oxidase
MPEIRDLREADADPDPLTQFRRWFAEAERSQPDAETMTLATATVQGAPSARMVLLRGFDERGFVFFTNFTSRKARELAENPQAALVLYWPALVRQVRIEGKVEIIAAAEADAYFRQRPRGSQLSAWASPQSQTIPSREFLEERVRQITGQFPAEVPRPPFWGGYRVRPHLIEFWQGGENRLHDRLAYRSTADGWLRERLGP